MEMTLPPLSVPATPTCCVPWVEKVSARKVEDPPTHAPAPALFSKPLCSTKAIPVVA
jgi:hypothetical protein